MALIKLEELQEFCKGKTIALVGNSSTIINSNLGSEIDNHDIVIRMNHAVSVLSKHQKDIGKRTDIYDCEVSSTSAIIDLIKQSNAKYVTRLIRWGKPIISPKEMLLKSIRNLYLGNPIVHKELKQTYFSDTVKPSTGAAVFNFLLQFIDFKSITLYGFDFFKSASNSVSKRNEFQSYNYKDHSSKYEAAYFKTFINDKTIKYIP